MRIPITLVVTLIFFQLVIDLYLFVIARKRCTKDLWPRVQLLTSVAFLGYLTATLMMPRRGGSDATLHTIMWLLFGYLSIYIPKLLFVITDILASVPRLWHARRLGWLSWGGAALSVILFFALWWAALINRFNINTNYVTLEVPELPDGFNGTRLVVFSDFHAGTFGSDTSFAEKLVTEINSLNPDAVFFTGDIVNRRTEELLPFTETFSHIRARYGIFSILGNHDYGDYSEWPSPEAKRQNMELMYELQSNMGWNLLRNDTAWLHNGNDSIAVIGVENWGDPPFPCYGDLSRAYTTISDNNIKILLTHNPYHWEKEISDNDSANVALTLSGHTHAMQMSVGHISPAAIRYDEWGGLYHDKKGLHPLYVNIGAGTVGIPMRLGATPEITVITLIKTSSIH